MSDSQNTATTSERDIPAGEHEPAAAATEPAEIIKDLNAKVTQLEHEKAELYDRLMRLAAEFENYKRRTRREIDEATGRGREPLLKELLPVLDNLERALGAVAQGGNIAALGEGVRLVEKQFHSSLEKFEVRRFESLGHPFDPTRHEAIQQVDNDAFPPNTVAQVFAQGYTMSDRLLRAALVAVTRSKAPSESEPAPVSSDAGN
jgi:molecular chaperone GrpE